MAGLKTYLETLRDQGVIDTATQTSFNEFALKQISDLYSNINGEDPSWLDKIISTYEKIVKVIKIVKEIYEWLSHLIPLHMAQMQYDYNSSDPTEVLCAIEEAVNNNYFTINFYTKAEVDALLQNANIDTTVFVRNDRVQNLSNAFHFSNTNNTINCALIAPQDIEIGLQHLNMVITGGLTNNTVIPTQGYVDTQDQAIISLFNNYYTKTEIDNMVPNMSNYYTKTEVDALIPNMSNYYTKTEVDALIPDISICVKNNSVQNLSNQFNFSNVANTWVGNTLVTNSITMGNYTLSSIVTAGIVNNNVIPSQGYVDTKITSELTTTLNNYYTKGDVDNMFNNNNNSQTWSNQIYMTNPLNSIAAATLTLAGIALGGIVTGGSSNNDKGVTQGYVDTKISTELSSYYTKTEVDTFLTNYYTKTETYSKTEVDNMITSINPQFANYYTKTEIDTMLQNYQKHGFLTFYILYEDTTGQYKDAQVGCWGDYYQKSATELILSIQVYTPIVSDQHSTNIDIWCAFNINSDFYGAAQTLGTGVFGSCLVTSQNSGTTCFASLDGNPHNLRFTIYRQNSNNSFSGGLDLKNDRWFLNFNNVHLTKI